MTAKEEVATFLRNMPDDLTFDEVMYELFVLEKLKVSMQASENGEVSTHDEVKERFKQWLTPEAKEADEARPVTGDLT
jgi:predicted transcriptional regulator